MFHDRRVNAKINRNHERALRIAYHDRTSSFDELLITDLQSLFTKEICSCLSLKLPNKDEFESLLYERIFCGERNMLQLKSYKQHLCKKT